MGARLREVEARLKEKAQEIREQCKVARKELHACAAEWRLGPIERKAVLILYTHAEFDCTPAMTYLRAVGNQHHWPQQSPTELRRIVEDTFLHADLNQLVALSDARQLGDEEAMHVAQGVLREWRVVLWAEAQNDCGVAPSSFQLLEKFDSLALPPCARKRTVTGRLASSARSWASRCCDLFRCALLCMRMLGFAFVGRVELEKCTWWSASQKTNSRRRQVVSRASFNLGSGIYNRTRKQSLSV